MAGKLSVLAQAIPAGSTVMIVQTPNDSPTLHYYIYASADSGSADVPFPISASGDVFDMYVQGTAWDTLVYWVDSKVVNAYSPAGSFAVTSEDPWIVGSLATGNYIKRTRADRTYGVSLTVSGLSADPTAPPSATSVRLDRVGVNYNTTTYSALGAVPYAQVSYSLGSNGISDWTVSNSLTPLNSTKVVGEERWQVYRLADINTFDGTTTVPETVINNVTVQVWPMSDVTLEGIVDGQEILDSLPSLSVQLKDVYPDSYTYCQVYKGTQVLGTVGAKVAGSEIFYGKHFTDLYNAEHGIIAVYSDATVEPQNPDKFFVSLSASCPTDGTYTLEVITETPFSGSLVTPVYGAERLKWITFKVNRRTAIRGTLSSGN